MKLVHRFIGSISALAGILLIILIAVNCIFIQDSFLNGTNERYKVHKNLSMSEEDLQQVVHAMISYVKGQADSPQVVVTIKDAEVEFFNQKELGHLADVQSLMRKLAVGAVILALVFIGGEVFLFMKKDYKYMVQGVFGAWIILAACVIVVGIIAVIDIELVITGFHRLCFSNENWVLNPALDRSVWMFRTNMYKDVLLTLIGIIGTVAVLSVGGAVWGLKKKSNK